MNITLPFVMGTLAVVFGAAIGVGLLLHARRHRRTEDVDADADAALGADGMAGAVGFIGGAAAFLLSVLMLASLDHYNATKAIVGDEALAYSAAFESTDGLEPADREKVRRDLVCLMRSVATTSWAAAESGNLTGSPNTHAWRRRALTDANSAVTRTKAEEISLGTLQSKLISASDSGQQRLLAADSDLPLALWILVFVSIFVLVAILTALLRGHQNRTFAAISLVAVLALCTAMLWTLNTFDEPFTQGDGVFISPRALNAVMARLQDTYPDANWGPCETLVNP
jgi:hypothetical protein